MLSSLKLIVGLQSSIGEHFTCAAPLAPTVTSERPSLGRSLRLLSFGSDRPPQSVGLRRRAPGPYERA